MLLGASARQAPPGKCDNQFEFGALYRDSGNRLLRLFIGQMGQAASKPIVAEERGYLRRVESGQDCVKRNVFGHKRGVTFLRVRP